jgi:predicted MPP superfamily phosphohydrolase
MSIDTDSPPPQGFICGTVVGAADQELRPTRRRFLGKSLALGGAGLLTYAWGIEPGWLDVVHREMPFAGLPPAWHGRKLLHLSDLHVGTTAAGHLEKTIERASALEADIAVVSGDFMTYETPGEIAAVATLVKRLRRPPLGIVACFGNHDYAQDWSDLRVADALERRLESSDVRVLRNEADTIDGLRFIGCEDYWSPRFSRRAIQRLSADSDGKPTIALCHNPDVCDEPVWQGFQGWVLAGHTHGGQCKLPLLPPPIVPVKNHRYAAGELELDGGRRLYVSRGIGYTHRIRFDVRPEITLFTLTAG